MKGKNNMMIKQIGKLLLLCLMLSGCGKCADFINVNKVTKPLRFGNISAIPTNITTNYMIDLYNDNDQTVAITNNSVKLYSVPANANYNDYIDISSCPTIAANSSCKIRIKTNKILNQTGQYGIEIYGFPISTKENKNLLQSSLEINSNPIVNDTQTGPSASQVISYQVFDISQAVNGIAYNTTISSMTTYAQKSQKITISIPLLFLNGKSPADYTLLAPANIKTSLTNCFGSSCTLEITYLGGSDFVSSINLLLNNDTVGTFNIKNINTPKALLFMGDSPSFITADGVQQLVLSVSNNGSAPATINNVSIEAPFQIIKNNCQGSLSVRQICTITVSANSITSGQAIVTLLYNDGISNSATTIYPIYYQGKNDIANIQVTYSGTDLQNVLLGNSATRTILFSNPSKYPITNFNVGYTNPTADGITTVINSCQNISILAAHQSCAIQFLFIPQTILPPTTFLLTANGTYAPNPNSPQATENIMVLGEIIYSSLDNPSDLISNSSLTMTAPINQAVESTITFTNNTQFNNISNIQFNLGGAESQVLSISDNQCANITLKPFNSCSVTFKLFGTTAFTGIGNIPITFNNNLLLDSTSLAYNLQIVGSNANIQLTNVTASTTIGGGTLSGNGTALFPYTFANLGNNLWLTFTYQNKGSATAIDTNFDANNHTGVNYQIVDTGIGQCPTGIERKDLAPSQSCTITLSTYPTFIVNSYSYESQFTIKIPSVNYHELIMDNEYFFVINTYTNPNDANSRFEELKPIALSKTTQTYTVQQVGLFEYQTTLTFTINDNVLSTTQNPISITISNPSDFGGFNFPNGYSCNIDPQSNSCDIVILNNYSVPSFNFLYTVSQVNSQLPGSLPMDYTNLGTFSILSQSF